MWKGTVGNRIRSKKKKNCPPPLHPAYIHKGFMCVDTNSFGCGFNDRDPDETRLGGSRDGEG